MGGGDLNMKKSWHPLLMRNQEKVWKDEQAHKEEMKRVEQLRREIEEERQLLELHRLQEAAGGKKRKDRVEWMYAVPNTNGPNRDSSEMEEYLLGRRRLDDLLKDKIEDQNNSLEKTEFIALQNANSLQDTQAKLRLDPLLAIKQQEQKQLQTLMEKRKYSLDSDRKSKERRHRDRHHRSNQDRSRERSDNEQHSSDKREHSRRSYRNDRNNWRERTHNDRYRHRDKYDSGYFKKHYDDDTRFDQGHFQDERDPKKYVRTSRQYSRSPSPDFRTRNHQFHSRDSQPITQRHTDIESRLQKMQDNAKELDESRRKKIELLEKKERDEEQFLEKERRDTARKWDNQGDFIRNMRKEIYSGDSVSLADRVNSSRHNMLRP
ncbi:Pre-mRNA-splicing factor cwf25 [Schizosaccharomyces pombe]